MINQGVIEEGKFKYRETAPNNDDVILLLHGLMGALSNFEGIMTYFADKYNVVFPELPIYSMPLRKLGITGLLDYVDEFVMHKGYKGVHVIGNSLGGHLAQLYALRRPELIKSITLTGSSGLFENAMGNTFPKRGNYEYIEQKVKDVFYNGDIATKEYVDHIYELVNNRGKAIRIVGTAKSAIRHNLADKLQDIKAPTLLVWGRDDAVTPLFVGEKFHELIPHSKLEIIDKCGHAPMMEHPEEFNIILEKFLNEVKESETV